MRKVHVGRTIAAGFVATLVMTIVMYGVPIRSLQRLDLAALRGSLLSDQMPAPGSGIWWLGLGMHLIAAAIFPFIYASLFPRLQGVWWGVMLWLIMEGVFMPLMGRDSLPPKNCFRQDAA